MAALTSAQRTTKFKQKMLLKALESTLGVMSPALAITKISPNTYNKWMVEDDEFAEQVETLQEGTLDFVETKLLKQIEDGNTQAAIFYLKTKGKHRGYTESATLDISNNDGSLAPTMIQLVAQPDVVLEGETVEEALIHHEDRTESE